LDTWREASRRIPRTLPATIRSTGLDYDLIDDDALAVTPADRYRVVVVPATTTIPDATATWLQRVTASGGSVIMVDSSVRLPGTVAATADALAGALTAAIDPDLAMSPSTPDIGFVHRRCGDADVYIVVNTGTQRRTFAISGRGGAASYAEWDPASGQVRRTETGCDRYPVTLHPYQATVIVRSGHETAGPDAPAVPEPGRWLRLDGPWRVAFAAGPPRPVRLPHVWEEEPDRRYFSGAATYTTTFELDLADVGHVLLLFGDGGAAEAGPPDGGALVGPSFRASVRAPVGEIAHVRLNGVACGVVWAPPYQLDVSTAARCGRNDIEVTVSNTAANALAADEQIVHLATDSEARYGRRFRMQELDRAMATVRSGLLTVPLIGLSVLTGPRSGSPTPPAA